MPAGRGPRGSGGARGSGALPLAPPSEWVGGWDPAGRPARPGASPHRVATLPAASRPPVLPLGRASGPGVRRVGPASRPRWVRVAPVSGRVAFVQNAESEPT